LANKFVLSDRNLEKESWKPRQANTTDIGDAVPKDYGYRVYPDSLEFFISSPPVPKGTPAWLGAIARPLPPIPGYSKLKFSYDIKLDGGSTVNARLLESDIRVSRMQQNFNTSTQMNYATGVWQVSNQKGDWVDTTLRMEKLTPWKMHHIVIESWFDFLHLVYGVAAITIDNFPRYPVPTNLQGLTPTKMAWEDSCSVQIQQGLNAAGGSFAQNMKNINLDWSE
jgi:hypothetical protein